MIGSRSSLGALLALSLAACSIDAILEGDIPPDTRLSIALPGPAFTVVQGGTATIEASITRLGDFRGPVQLTVSDLPARVVAEVGTLSTTGAVTSTTVTVRAEATAPVGSYLLTVRGTANPNGVVVSTIELRVAPRPAVTVAPVNQVMTIIRGGIAPLGVSLERTAFADPVALSLSGPPGISATLAGGGSMDSVEGSTANLTMAVAAGVVPGTYPVTLRCSAAGIAASEVTLSVVVSPDALQLIVADAATVQASVVTAGIIVNRLGAGSDVAFSVDGLPAGVAATFTGGAASSTAATMRISVSSAVEARTYNLGLRGRSAGIPDAVAPFVLTVAASNVAVTLVPSTVTLLQGGSAASTLTLVRSAFPAPVAIQLADVPTGIRVTAADASVSGSTTTLLVTTDATVAPGRYTATVRAIPAPVGGAGTPALDAVVSTLTITVIAAPSGDGNVILDWSSCAAPTWVAAQDGNGPWVQVVGVQGVYRFAVTERGGYAYVSGDSTITVRLGTLDELAGLVALCPPAAPPLRTVSGTAQHQSIPNAVIGERFTWHLGGGVGTSTFEAPKFDIVGVRPGTHDLIGWGVPVTGGRRVYLRRDLAPADSIGTVSLSGDNSFPVASAAITFNGFISESWRYTTTYLSGTDCVGNTLVDSASAVVRSVPLTTNHFGIPAEWQRPTDRHRIEMTANGAGGRRTVTSTVTALAISTYSLPPVVTAEVATLTGSYRRMRGGVQVPNSQYNGALTFAYTSGARTTTITASLAYFGSGPVQVEMPELGGVSGFPASAAIPTGATGSWALTVDGSNGRAACADGALRWSNTRRGTF